MPPLPRFLALCSLLFVAMLHAQPVASTAVEAARPTLFIAALRPESSAPDSAAYGTATLRLAPDGTHAHIDVAYANLTSPPVSAHLKLGAPGDDGVYLRNLSTAQPVSLDWDLSSGPASVSSATILRALSEGRIYVGIDSRNYPAGELRGAFIRATGSSAFSPPPPPPPLPSGLPSPRDAARFLTQATFGPTRADLDALLAQGYSPWLDAQFALPASSHLAAARADYATFGSKRKKKPRLTTENRQAAWWQLSVHAPDQLRQRVAFALSELFVVSEVGNRLNQESEAVAAYYDLLAAHAFGNFRTLLEDVTLSPVMGAYLSHLGNAKGDPRRHTSPDENYAREVMQLFTLGLHELQPDGTLRLDAEGRPLPTYDQTTITETARVFTGWGSASDRPRPKFRAKPANLFAPMRPYPEFHDDGPKTIVGGRTLPAGQGAQRDLEQTLDALFQHPNTGPFVCRRLIQRLVTSNPSPAYVWRVAQVFARNAEGVRGDLGAVVRAILLDYEARSPAMLEHAGFGKLKEPLLRVTALLRAADAAAPDGRLLLANAEDQLGQAPLRSPTVFNFFEPDYVLPGPLAAAGLYAPEYQLLTANSAITVPNVLHGLIYAPPTPRPGRPDLNLARLLALSAPPGPLIAELDLLLCAGALPAAERERILAALAALPPSTGPRERVRCALELVATAPAAAIQR